MIVDPDDIREIRKGQQVAVAVKRQLEVGSRHLVQAGVGKKAVCTVEVFDIWQHVDSGYVALVGMVAREVLPRYITAKGTRYTTDPAKAATDPATGQKEWAPPSDWEDPGVIEARREFHRLQQSDTIERLLPSVENWDDLVRIKQLARAAGIDIRSDLRAIEARIESIGRKLRREAA